VDNPTKGKTGGKVRKSHFTKEKEKGFQPPWIGTWKNGGGKCLQIWPGAEFGVSRSVIA